MTLWRRSIMTSIYRDGIVGGYWTRFHCQLTITDNTRTKATRWQDLLITADNDALNWCFNPKSKDQKVVDLFIYLIRRLSLENKCGIGHVGHILDFVWSDVRLIYFMIVCKCCIIFLGVCYRVFAICISFGIDACFSKHKCLINIG